MIHGHAELVPCTRESYGAVVKGLRGDRDFNETFTVLSGYTRVDGDEFGPGRCVETVWGLGSVPVFGCRLQAPEKPDEYFAHWLCLSGVSPL